MDATKLHLILNYFPLIGTVTGLAVLLYQTRKASEIMLKTGLGILVLTAIVTLMVFGTGEAAGKGSDQLVGQVPTNIQAHKASALAAFAVIEATGVFALFGYINLLRKKTLTRWLIITVLLLSFASAGLTARTVILGRSIHSADSTKT